VPVRTCRPAAPAADRDSRRQPARRAGAGAARRGAADRPGAGLAGPAPADRRLHHHPRPDRQRDAGPAAAPGAARRAARRPGPAPRRGRRTPALRRVGARADAAVRRRGSHRRRHGDPGRRPGAAVDRLGQPGPGPVRPAGPAGHHPDRPRARRLRARDPLLRGGAAGPVGGWGGPAGVARALPGPGAGLQRGAVLADQPERARAAPAAGHLHRTLALPGRAGRVVGWDRQAVRRRGMFGSLGWGEILMLGVIALFVFGPDKLPKVARDAARMLRRLRGMANGARTQPRSDLGPEFADLDFASLTPRTFVRKHLFDDTPLYTPFSSPVDEDLPHQRPRPAPAPLRDGERPPF